MNTNLHPKFENVVVPPMTESLRNKLNEARLEKIARDENLAGIRAYTGIKHVKPDISEDDIEFFMNCLVSDKEQAIEILIINSIIGENSKGSLSYYLLKTLHRKIIFSEFSDEQLCSLFHILADVTDEMTKISGPIAPSMYRISYKCTSISKDIIKAIPSSKRKKTLITALDNGNAKSFVISFIWRILIEHKERSSFWETYVPLLSRPELKKIEEIAFTNVKEILNNGMQSVPDSIYLFLFWYELGTDRDRIELRNWIQSKTHSDGEFIQFISVFSEKARIRMCFTEESVIWVVYTEILELILGNRKFIDRLKDISNRDTKVAPIAKELLERIRTEKKLKKAGKTLRKFFGD